MNILFTIIVKILVLNKLVILVFMIMLTIEFRIVIKFEHIVQFFLVTCPFGIRSWSHTRPHITQK